MLDGNLDPTIDLLALPSAEAARVYAIGDIHGRLDLLLELEAAIERDLADRPVGGAALVCYLGDYVDRGPASAGVIEHLAARAPDGLARVYLKGNHEARMVDFLVDPAGNGPAWLRFGGREALMSYGLTEALLDSGDWDAMRERFAAALPDHHLAFLEGLDLALLWQDHLFVHAGLHPERGLGAQTLRDLMWIREPFLSSEHDWGVRVVHGHTIEPDPVFRPNRLGLDTGAFKSGVLTCGVIEAGEVRILQTGVSA